MNYLQIIKNLLPNDHTAEIVNVKGTIRDIHGKCMEKGWYIKSTEKMLTCDMLRTLKCDYREKVGECQYNYYKIET